MTDISKLIGEWAISSGGDATKRCIQWVDDKTGWPGFVETYVRPVLAQGIKRIWLHGPFGRDAVDSPKPNEYARILKFSDGTTGPSSYRFDEYLCSKFQGLEWNTDNFVSEMRQLTKLGIEVICYLGTLDGAWEFEDRSKYAQTKFFQRITDSLSPLLDSGCSVSIDSSCRATPDSYCYALLLMLKSRGIKTYIESIPQISHQHLWQFNAVCTDVQWINVVGNPTLYPDPRQLPGEMVRLLTGKPAQYPDVKSWYLDVIPKAFHESPNYSVAANLTHLLKEGVRIEELLK